jgi:hypothetical protein
LGGERAPFVCVEAEILLRVRHPPQSLEKILRVLKHAGQMQFDLLNMSQSCMSSYDYLLLKLTLLALLNLLSKRLLAFHK